MERTNFKDLWLLHWNEWNILGKLFLIIAAPYLWLCYGLANSGYIGGRNDK